MIMLYKNFKQNKSIIIIFALSGLVTLTWFKGSNIISTLDFTFIYDRPLYLKYTLSVWDDITALGLSNFSVISLIPFSLYLYATKYLSLSLTQAEKLFFYFTFTGSLVSMYFLALKMGIRKNGAVFASLFFAFNIYAAANIWNSSHGMLQIPYAFLPLVLLLYINGLENDRSLRWMITASIIWFMSSILSYTNPAFAFIQWIVIFTYMIVSILKDGDSYGKFKYTGKLMVVWLALNSIWVIPLFAYITYVQYFATANTLTSSLSTYKDTSIPVLNALRLFGSWTGGGSYKGDPYTYWQPVFTSFPLSILSFLPSMLALFAFYKTRKLKRTYFASVLFIVSLIFIKGVNPPLGVFNTFIQTKVPFFATVFRNLESKWGILLAFSISLLIGISIDKITEFLKQNKRLKQLLALVMTSIILVLSYPTLDGSLFYVGGNVIPSNLTTIPSYYKKARNWLDKDSSYFRLSSFPLSKRVYTTYKYPRGYFSAGPDKWLLGRPVIDTTIGNGGPILDDIGKSTEQKVINPYIPRILGSFSVKYLIMHNDTNWQFIDGHPWWYNASRESIRKFYTQNPFLNKQKSFQKLSFYKIDSKFVNKHIFIPKKIIWINNNVNLSTLSSYITPGSVFVISNKNDSKYDEDIVSLSKRSVNLPSNGKYGLSHISNGVSYYKIVKNRNSIALDPLNPEIKINGIKYTSNMKPIVFKNSGELLKIDDQFYDTNKNNTVSLIPGKHNFTVYKKSPEGNLAPNASFEKNEDIKAIDCSDDLPGKPKIKALRSNDSKSGKYSLQLDSLNHWAGKRVVVNSYGSNNVFRVSFWHKHVQGINSPAVGIWQTGEEVTNPFITLPNSAKWSNYEVYFKTSKNTKNISVYFYTIASGKQKESNRFDDLSVVKYIPVYDKQIDLDSSEVFKYQDIAKINFNDKKISTSFSKFKLDNLAKNGDFEDGLNQWNKLFDATSSLPGKPKISAKVITINKRQHALALSSSNHWAGISYDLQNFDEFSDYKITFKYKNFKGKNNGRVSLRENPATEGFTAVLPYSKKWRKFSFYYSPKTSEIRPSLFLYTIPPVNGSLQTVLFDNIKVQKFPSNGYFFLSRKNNGAKQRLPEINFSKISQTKYIVRIKNAKKPFLLVFNEGYDPLWKAVVLKNEIKGDAGKHIKVNKGLNGWWIDKKGDYLIVLEFAPQRIAWLAIGITIVVFVFYCLMIGYLTRVESRQKQCQ